MSYALQVDLIYFVQQRDSILCRDLKLYPNREVQLVMLLLLIIGMIHRPHTHTHTPEHPRNM